MTQNEIIITLETLGKKLESFQLDNPILEKARLENPWFTIQSQANALDYWAIQLNAENLTNWLSKYSYTSNPKKVGLIMAGNIPLVGFHDLICILASGHKALVKLSSTDTILPKWIINQLFEINPELREKLEVADKLNNCEALIATGSNNTARYFNYYFKNIPRIIRKNRNSLAILTGKETKEELRELANDIFIYFGLGCRNVSKLLVPENYNFNTFFEALESFNELINHNKYYNNYTYHKALFLMNLETHFDNGFILLKEDEKLSSPLGCLFYSTYKERNDVIEYLDQYRDQIQIAIGNPNFISECRPFGQSQYPKLNDYADDVDTLQFLNQL